MAVLEGAEAVARDAKGHTLAVRKWASHRWQSVWRTIAGMSNSLCLGYEEPSIASVCESCSALYPIYYYYTTTTTTATTTTTTCCCYHYDDSSSDYNYTNTTTNATPTTTAMTTIEEHQMDNS